MGGGAFHPRRKRQAGGWEQGRAKATEPGGRRRGWGRAPLRIHASGTALVLFLAGEGLETKTQFQSLSSLLHPEHVRDRRGLQEGRQGHLA